MGHTTHHAANATLRDQEFFPAPLLDEMAKEIVLPTQVADREVTPSARLWYRVLIDALRVAQSRGLKRPVDEARAWLASESEEVGAYRWLCEELGLAAEVLRQKLAAGEAVVPVLEHCAGRRFAPIRPPRLHLSRAELDAREAACLR